MEVAFAKELRADYIKGMIAAFHFVVFSQRKNWNI